MERIRDCRRVNRLPSAFYSPSVSIQSLGLVHLVDMSLLLPSAQVGRYNQIECSPGPVHLIGSCLQNTCLHPLWHPKTHCRQGATNSAANDVASISRSLPHNVPLNIQNNILLCLSGKVSNANENNISYEDCQQIGLLALYRLRRPVQNSSPVLD